MKHNYQFIRLFLLLFLAELIVLFAFLQVRDLTLVTNSIAEVNKERSEYLESQSGTFQDAFADVSSLIKAPISLLYFDLYLHNFRVAELEPTKERIPLSMNTEVNGIYNHEIRFGEIRKIASSVRGGEIPGLLITRSYRPENRDEIPLASTTPVIGSYYLLSIWPTWESLIFIYLVAGIPLAYGVFVLINACRRFVLFGAPFTDK